MLRFVSCIAVEHNLLFTVAALCICVAGALVFSSLVVRSADRRGTVHAALVLMSGLIGGATVWTTHFVAMLGYRTDLILGYDLVATLGSLLIAVATTTVATAIATSTLRKAGARLGGAVLGAGISLMHYAGIVAMQLQGTVAWDPSGVLLSIAAALGFSMLAMDGAGDGTGRSRTIYAAAALVLGISSMHFIGMSAMTVTPAPVNDTVGSVSNEAIALAIVATVSILITLGAATWAIDNANTRDAREGYRYLSLHDPLTSLPNRQHLKLLLEQMISSRGPGEPRAAVVVLELGQLRAVNEVHGRDVGDRILQRFAKRVSTSLSHDEHLGRFDGMSFIAIKSGVGSREEALEFGNRLLTLALTPIAFEGAQDIQVGVSLGVATIPMMQAGRTNCSIEPILLPIRQGKWEATGCVPSRPRRRNSAGPAVRWQWTCAGPPHAANSNWSISGRMS